MSNDNRKDPRRDLTWGSLIVDIDESIICQCRTVNVSATGAKITLIKQMDVPDEFFLMLTTDGKVRRRCKIAWRSEADIGVRFVSAIEEQAVAPKNHIPD
jgi:hypothetical protein